jgi:endo-1,4-beta-D-glucanase Y
MQRHLIRASIRQLINTLRLYGASPARKAELVSAWRVYRTTYI